MSFEEAKQYLRTEDKDGDSLYEHLSKVLLKIITEKPAEANAMFEEISQGLRASGKSVPGLPLEGDVVPCEPEKQEQLAWCEGMSQLFSGEPSSEPSSESFPDLVTEANVFEWAGRFLIERIMTCVISGISLGKTETYRLYLAMKAKAVADGAKLRFWGKVLGSKSDYYVVQGENPEVPEDPATIEGAEGANRDAFWVCASAGGAWTKLPNATPESIVAARQIKRFLTGDLTSVVASYPPFPGGTEAHFLRAQIALITADCSVSPDGFYAEDDEDDSGLKKIRKVDDIEDFKSMEDLKDAANWKHHELPVNLDGRCNRPPADEENDADNAEETSPDDALPHLPVLAPLTDDLPAWKITACPGGAAGESPDSVVVAKSLKWPGAVAAAFGNKFINVYCGFGYPASRGTPFQPPRVPPILQEWTPASEEDKDLIEDADVITQPVVENEDDEDA